jgi:hypothetical protein
MTAPAGGEICLRFKGGRLVLEMDRVTGPVGGKDGGGVIIIPPLLEAGELGSPEVVGGPEATEIGAGTMGAGPAVDLDIGYRQP